MASSHIVHRSIYNYEPPAYQSRNDVNPTLLVSWWCTVFALTTILIRLFGRYVRTEKLFREDKIMAYSIIPLMIRMGLVHVILIYGTSNVDTTGLTTIEIMHRQTGTKLVLAARIFYAAFIWIAKLTVLEFLKRTIQASWVKSYEIGLRLIYGFLVVTFIAVIIGTLAECHPFSNYWQVIPDPGPQCREGLVQLIVMGICDIVTDLVLIIFPIPLVMGSSMPLIKKLSLIALFLLSILLIAITAYRIPSTISRRSAQPYRSLLASLEILAATGVANAVVIGSFIRDKGVKKAKFRAASVGENSTLSRVPTRTMSMTLNHWGSDEDLVRDMGVALPVLLRHNTTKEDMPRVAPVATAAKGSSPPQVEQGKSTTVDREWNFNKAGHRSRQRRDSDSSESSNDTDIRLTDLRTQLQEDPATPKANIESVTPNKLSFFDVGGLVDKPADTTPSGTSREASIKGGASRQESISLPRSGSRAFLSDIGVLLSRHREEDEITPVSAADQDANPRAKSKSKSKSPERRVRKFSRSPRPSRVLEEDLVPIPNDKGGPDSLNISDAGGLLK